MLVLVVVDVGVDGAVLVLWHYCCQCGAAGLTAYGAGAGIEAGTDGVSGISISAEETKHEEKTNCDKKQTATTRRTTNKSTFFEQLLFFVPCRHADKHTHTTKQHERANNIRKLV